MRPSGHDVTQMEIQKMSVALKPFLSLSLSLSLRYKSTYQHGESTVFDLGLPVGPQRFLVFGQTEWIETDISGQFTRQDGWSFQKGYGLRHVWSNLFSFLCSRCNLLHGHDRHFLLLGGAAAASWHRSIVDSAWTAGRCHGTNHIAPPHILPLVVVVVVGNIGFSTRYQQTNSNCNALHFHHDVCVVCVCVCVCIVSFMGLFGLDE